MKYEKQSQKRGQARKQERRGSGKLRDQETRRKKERAREDESFLCPTRES